MPAISDRPALGQQGQAASRHLAVPCSAVTRRSCRPWLELGPLYTPCVAGSMPFIAALNVAFTHPPSFKLARVCSRLPPSASQFPQALQSGQLSRRMSVAAHLSGHTDESRFWAALPATLAHIKTLQDAIQQRQQQQQEQQLSRRTSAASTATLPGGSTTELTNAGTPRSSTAAGVAVGGVTSTAAVPEATPTAEAASAAGAGDASSTMEADDSIPDPSDYDFMVQQALESSSLQAGQPTPASPIVSSSIRGAAAAAEVAGASPLARRGSGAVVPGRGLYSGPPQQQFSSQGAIRRVAQGMLAQPCRGQVVQQMGCCRLQSAGCCHAIVPCHDWPSLA